MKNLSVIIIGLVLFTLKTHSQVVTVVPKGNHCINSTIKFNIKPQLKADTWLWDFGDGSSSTDADSTEHAYALSGTYTVVLTRTINGNPIKSPNVIITIGNNPTCSFTTDTTIYSSFTRTFIDGSLSETSKNHYFWDFGDGSQVGRDSAIAQYKYSEEGTYTVWHKITDNNGCSDSMQRNVVIENIYRVPNVFTPNGDGINDNFIVTVNGVDFFSIEIYSRWGNLVFKRNGMQQIVWDGTMPDGSKVNPGTYFYVITANNAQRVYEPETGFVTIFYEKGGNGK